MLDEFSNRRNDDCHPLARQPIAHVALFVGTVGPEDADGVCVDALITSASGAEQFDIGSSVGDPAPLDVEGDRMSSACSRRLVLSVSVGPTFPLMDRAVTLLASWRGQEATNKRSRACPLTWVSRGMR